MFKSGRWRSKNKFKTVFMLQFQATEVPKSKKSGVTIALVPEDVGKPTVKLEKAPILDGTCSWENPVYETVKLIRESKTGKIKEKIYHFIVSTGSSKSGFLGEASIDFADFAMGMEPMTVSLPLKFANSGAVLHVTILRMEGPDEPRDVEDNEAMAVHHENSLKNQLSFCSSDGNYDFTEDGLFDMTSQKTALASSWGIPSEQKVVPQKGTVDASATLSKRSNWSVGSASDGSLVDSSNSLEDNVARERLQEVSDDSIEKLRSEIAILMRQASVSELELQTLRRQLVKETKRGQSLSTEIVGLKEERDVLQRECSQLKSLQKRNDVEAQSQLKSENQDLRDLLEEIKKELDHEEDLNSNLRTQLQKTQDSNSELALAVKDLNEMLEQKDREIEMSRNLKEVPVTNCKCNINKDEYHAASDTGEIDSLKQKITDLCGEIEVYRKHKDNLANYVEQLTVDNEILKQENHETASKLEQKQLEESMKAQTECSRDMATQNELESHVERLEGQIERQAKELSESVLSINELESQVKQLKKELEKQAKQCRDELDAITSAKVLQERRAVRAEEALRKARQNSIVTAERLKEEFRRHSVQMASEFDENEKLTKKALAEASELHEQKRILEEMLQKSNEELEHIKDHNVAKLQDLSNQLDSKVRENQQVSLELDDKCKQLEYAKRHEQEKHEAFSAEIQTLRNEIEKLSLENYNFSQRDEEKHQRKGEAEEMKTSTSEREIQAERWNREREDLSKKFASAKTEAEKLQEELTKMRSSTDENERIIRKLQSEKQNMRTQYSKLKDRLHEEESDKENLTKQVIKLKDELQKKEKEISQIEKKLKDNSVQTAASEASMTNMKKKIKFLEEQVKLKEAALETARSSYQEKERNLNNMIKKLEGKMDQLKHGQRPSADAVQKEARCVGRTVDNMGQHLQHSEMSKEASMSAQSERKVQQKIPNGDEYNLTELLTESTLLKERNKSMESELKDMQERYTEISLKFAEVEGERQQLVMIVRNLKNGKKN